MMDRIEDETIPVPVLSCSRMRKSPGIALSGTARGEEEETPGSQDGHGANGTTADQKAAQNTFQDFTRNIQRKKGQGTGRSAICRPVMDPAPQNNG